MNLVVRVINNHYRSNLNFGKNCLISQWNVKIKELNRNLRVTALATNSNGSVMETFLYERVSLNFGMERSHFLDGRKLLHG